MSATGDKYRQQAGWATEIAATLNAAADAADIINPPPTTEPPPVTQPPVETTPPTGRDDIVKHAGLTNASILKASGSVTSTKAGQIIENLKINGTVTLNHNDCTIRNCEIHGTSSKAIVSPARGISGTIVEHCVIESIGSGTTKGATGCVGYLGVNTTVRYCHCYGYSDGIKLETGGTYEGNYVHTGKPSTVGTEGLHCDGMQASADSNIVIRNNVIEQPTELGGNSAIFMQGYNGAQNVNYKNIVVTGNYLKGGNYTVFVEGGKGTTNDGQFISDIHLVGNFFYGVKYFYNKNDPKAVSGQAAEDIVRFGYLHQENAAQTEVKGNKYWNGTPITATVPTGSYNAKGFAQDA